jgi:hypothetical protein
MVGLEPDVERKSPRSTRRFGDLGEQTVDGFKPAGRGGREVED